MAGNAREPRPGDAGRPAWSEVRSTLGEALFWIGIAVAVPLFLLIM